MYHYSITEMLFYFRSQIKKITIIFLTNSIVLISLFSIFYPTIYQHRILFIVNETNINPHVYSTSNDFKLSPTYANIILSDYIIEQISKEQHSNINKNNINDFIILQQDRNTKVFELIIKSDSINKVNHLSADIQEVIKKEIPNILGEVEIKFISTNDKNYIKKVSPKWNLIIATSCWIASLISILYFLLVIFKNKTLKSERDVENELGLPILGTINMRERRSIE